MMRLDELESRRSLMFMRNPEWWPHRPVLPLHHQVDRDDVFCDLMKLGYMLEGSTTVYLGLMFDPPASCRKIEYKNIEDIVDSGWVVD